MAIITSVINWKGGVGKTTLTHHLGTGLTFRRKRTLLIDLDPQCNLSYLTTGVEGYMRQVQSSHTPTIKDLFESFLQERPIPSRDLIRKNAVTSSRGNVYNYVDIVYSHAELTYVDNELSRYKSSLEVSDPTTTIQTEVSKLSVLKHFLQEVEQNYDYIFIDCPPSLHPLTQNAVFASHYFLIPALPDYLSTVGITYIMRLIETLDDRFHSLCHELGEDYRSTQCAGVIFNKVNEYRGAPIRAHQHYMDQIRLGTHEFVFYSYLVDGHGISDAAQKNQPVYTTNSNQRTTPKAQRQIQCFEQILSEFLARVHKGVLL